MFIPNPENLENIPRAIRGNNFSFTVSFSENTGGTINSVTATHSTNADDTVNIVNTTTSFTASGKYLAGWNDVFTYTSAGVSNKQESSTTAVGTHNMPADKNLFSLSQDTTDIKTKTYNVIVNYTELVGVPPTLVPIIKEGSITIQHKCHNNLETIRAFMDNYNYNEHQNASSN